FEDQVRQLIVERFSRGKFNITVTWTGAGDTGEVLRVNETVADRYVALLDQLRKRYKLESGLDMRTLAQLPDVFTWEHTALTDEETWALVKTVVNQAADNMEAMKAREGQSLARDLEHRLKILREQLDLVSERAPLRPMEAKERLMTRV